jgi:hypothetical protein
LYRDTQYRDRDTSHYIQDKHYRDTQYRNSQYRDRHLPAKTVQAYPEKSRHIQKKDSQYSIWNYSRGKITL